MKYMCRSGKELLFIIIETLKEKRFRSKPNFIGLKHKHLAGWIGVCYRTPYPSSVPIRAGDRTATL